MSEVVRFEKQDDIGLVIIDSPPVNALSGAVRQGLSDCFARAAADPGVTAVVLLCEGRTFVAGADLGELDGAVGELGYHLTFGEIEFMDKPVVAALHGTALGGGVELALACHYRVAAESARLGFPEINLGLVPGAGGTQRLPRLIGVKPALDMILSGRPVDAEQALSLGLVDAVSGEDLRDFSVEFARSLVREGKGVRRVGAIALQKTPGIEALLESERERVKREFPNRLVPGMDIDAVEAAIGVPLSVGIKREKVISDASLQTVESKAMRRLFFAERLAAKIPGVDAGQAREIRSGAIIGAGTMGRGIAMAFANSGIPVVLLDVDRAAADKGLSMIAAEYDKRVQRGRMAVERAAECTALVSASADYTDIGESDVVIEAVFENMALKQEIFARLGKVCKPGAVLASNTSTLDVAEIGAASGRPGDIVGLHFFSPAQVMRLLEIVRTDQTSDEIIATAMKLAGRLRKVGVLSANHYGFIGNRIMDPYGREAERMLLEGATPARIDAALEKFGMAMGILAVYDMAGVDVGVRVREERKDHLPEDPSYYKASALLVENGMLGQKTGAGYYRYEAGSRQRHENPKALELFAKEARRLGIPPREHSDEEIIERCIFALINEGFCVLEEKVALRASDVDVVYTAGYGFPRHLGGPMFHADTVGLHTICARLNEFAERFGPMHWQVSGLLRDLAKAGKQVADYP